MYNVTLCQQYTIIAHMYVFFIIYTIKERTMFDKVQCRNLVVFLHWTLSNKILICFSSYSIVENIESIVAPKPLSHILLFILIAYHIKDVKKA